MFNNFPVVEFVFKDLELNSIERNQIIRYYQRKATDQSLSSTLSSKNFGILQRIEQATTGRMKQPGFHQCLRPNIKDYKRPSKQKENVWNFPNLSMKHPPTPRWIGKIQRFFSAPKLSEDFFKTIKITCILQRDAPLQCTSQWTERRW